MSITIFQEELMDHYRFPRHRIKLENPSVELEDKNPSCGDRVCIQAQVDNNKLTKVGFQGAGCILSQAATSILLDSCVGKSVDEVKTLKTDDLLAMVGISLGPTRIKCALLCLQVLQHGLENYCKRVEQKSKV